jgi:hypothetical protein
MPSGDYAIKAIAIFDTQSRANQRFFFALLGFFLSSARPLV